MKVVHMSDSLMSGAPYRLAQIQKLCGIEARVVNREEFTNGGPRQRAYPYDLLISAGQAILQPILEEADIIHYHHRWQDSELFSEQKWAWEVVKHKPSLMQFHVPRDSRYEDVLRDDRVVKLVVAQYQVRMYPECIPVQNAVPIDDEFHRPLWIENEPPIVAFTPPDCQADSWWYKGCAETLPVLRQGFRHRFVTDSSWHESMKVRARCDIAIDEIVSGGYHMCSLEALSQGLATIAGLDSQTIDALESVTGTRKHPWIVARPDTLRQTLAEVMADRAYLRAKRAEAREYMVRYWHPEVVVRRIQEIYRLVLERHGH